MFNVGIKDISEIRKKYNLKKNDALSSSQFREAQALSLSSSSSKNKKSPFSFVYSVDSISKEFIQITIWGNHISKNVYDGLPRWGTKSKHSYVASIKKGAREFFLKQRGFFLKHKKNGNIPMEKSFISYTFYSTVSRDWDNNLESVKRFQDTLVSLSLISEDKRKNLSPELNPIREVIIKDKKERKCVIEINLVQ